MELAAERAAERLPVERILSAAKDEDENVRLRLCGLLRLFPEASVGETLTGLANDSAERVRHAAIESLARVLGSVRVVRHLGNRASSDDLVFLADTLLYTDSQAEEALLLLQQSGVADVEAALREWREDG